MSVAGLSLVIFDKRSSLEDIATALQCQSLFSHFFPTWGIQLRYGCMLQVYRTVDLFWCCRFAFWNAGHYRYAWTEVEKWEAYMEQSRASIERDFRSIVGNQLGMMVNRLPGGTMLSALGFDHAGLLRLVYAVEGHFDVKISNRPWSGAFTLDECIVELEMVIEAGRRNVTEPVMAEGAD